MPTRWHHHWKMPLENNPRLTWTQATGVKPKLQTWRKKHGKGFPAFEVGKLMYAFLNNEVLQNKKIRYLEFGAYKRERERVSSVSRNSTLRLNLDSTGLILSKVFLKITLLALEPSWKKKPSVQVGYSHRSMTHVLSFSRGYFSRHFRHYLIATAPMTNSWFAMTPICIPPRCICCPIQMTLLFRVRLSSSTSFPVFWTSF